MEISQENIPESQPQWLDEWPRKNDFLKIFPPGVRLHYKRSNKPLLGGLSFHDDGFAVTLDGRFRVQWRLQGNNWSRSCGCAYPKDNCIHAWYSTLVIEYCARQKGWELTCFEKTAPLVSERKSYSPGKSISYPAPPLPRVPINARQSSATGELSLVVEADFKLNPGLVTLRFYEVQNERRRLLRVQQLHNIISLLQYRPDAPWRERDREFLGWLRKQVSDPRLWKTNLQVLKIGKKMFDAWVKTWNSEPDRFIDRDTQQALAFTVTAGIHFELQEEGEKTRLHCYVSTSDENKQDFFRIYSTIREKSKCTLQGVGVKLNIPISWQTLVDCFSKKTPSLPTGKVCDALPVLLEGKLELLKGDTIIHQGKEGDVYLQVDTNRGEIVFDAVDSKGRSIIKEQGKSTISKKDGKYYINSLQSPVFEIINKLSDKLEPGADNSLVFPQSVKIMKNLVNWWPTLEVPKMCSETLEGALSEVSAAKVNVSLREEKQWLNYSLSWQCQGAYVSHDEMQRAVKRGESLMRTNDGHWLQLDLPQIQNEMKNLSSLDIDTSMGRKLAFEAPKLIDQLQNTVEFSHSSRQLVARLKNTPEPQPAPVSEHLKGILRSYQSEGVEFMHHRLSVDLGVILADDMGLGKTLQTIALIEGMKSDQPILVVAPASVLYVWRDEVEKFAPQLKTALLVGAAEKRNNVYKNYSKYNILIGSYHSVRNDLEKLQKINFSLLVLDEAQVIKNPHAKVTQAVKSLNADKRLALSGTPVENRLADLWSIFDYLNPGYLGTLESFNDSYEHNPGNRRELAARVKPLILRRTKGLVAKELPARTEEVIRCTMSDKQYSLYSEQVQRAKQNAAGNNFSIFAALTRLRQVCCDPRLLKDGLTEAVASTKLKCLLDMLGPIIEEGHSVLVFSQFTSMLEIIESEITKLKMKSFKLTGAVPTTARPKLVKAFNDEEDASVFLLSLKAAGTGLTLTKADYVFLFDPWWNPAAEQQAIDRAHRIGQDKPVFVYKLIVKDSVEEKVLMLQDEKKAMGQEVLDDDVVPPSLKTKDLLALLE
ncbi:MAG: DEAD/DEAH box helicase [Lentisphaeraceae bacterium]|nr:DEAD/DEAH box helicase [Lentisphaeraceae bacterium]